METPLDQGLVDQNQNTEYLQLSLNDSLGVIRRAGMWFFYIAALSLVNSFLASSGTYFIVGLAISQVVDALTMGFLGKINYLAILAVPFVFSVFGFFAIKGHRWAFITGAMVYVIDALMYLYVGQWLAVAFHAFVLYRLWVGFSAISEYDSCRRKLENSI